MRRLVGQLNHHKVRLVGLYALVSGLWIVCSDYLVSKLFDNPSQVALISTLKGWLFVAVTSIVLLIAIDRDPSNSADIVGPKRSLSWPILAITGGISLVVVLIGATGFDIVAAYIRQHETERLVAVAETKRDQIEAWLAERRASVAEFMASQWIGDAFDSLSAGQNPAVAAQLADRLEATRSEQHYVGIALRHSDGRVLADAGESLADDPEYLGAIERAAHQSDPVVIDFHRDYPNGPLRLGMVGAIHHRHNPNRPDIGFISIEIDPERTLYPLLRSWPGNSESAETLIVRRDGEFALFLNPLRNDPTSALALRLPLDHRDVSAVQSLIEGAGVYLGHDYRGEAVLSVARRIAGTPWMLIAKIDRTEVFAGVRVLVIATAALGVGGLVVISAILVILWRQEQLRHRVALAQRLEAVARVAPGVLFTFCRHADGQTSIPYAAPALRDVVGLDAAAVRGGIEPLVRLIPSEERLALTSSMALAKRSCTGWHHQWPIEHPVKGLRWLEGQALPEPQVDGSVLWHGILLDITDRRRLDLVSRRFGVTLMSIGDGVIATDSAGRIEVMNPVAETLTGWTAEQAIGRRLEEVFLIINEETRQPVENPVALVLRQGTIVGLANHTLLLARDGSERPIADSGAPINDSRGGISGVVLVFRDQTEERHRKTQLKKEIAAREQALAELQASENRLNAIIDQAPLAILVTDQEGVIFRVNAIAEQIFACRSGWLIGRSVEELMPERYRNTHISKRIGFIAQGQSRDMSGRELTAKRCNGEEFSVELGLGITSIDNTPCIIISINDISDRKRAAEQLNELIDRLTLATRAAGVGVWDLNIGTGQLSWNDEMYAIYSVNPTEFVGTVTDWSARLHPDDREQALSDYRAALAGDRDFFTDFRIVRDDGSIRAIQSRALVYRNAAGEPVRMIGTNWDITSYQEALANLKEAKDQAETANAAKSRFLAAMSHELRTPLNAIIGFSELLLNSDLAPMHMDSIRIICEAGRNLLHVIQDILDLTKIEMGKVACRISRFDLRQYLARVIAQFGAEANAKSLSITLNIAPNVPQNVDGDPDLLRQVLLNLIGNAVKFTEKGGVDVEVVLDASVDDESPLACRLVFHIRDTGIGIRPENQSRIFEMFEQEDDTMTRRYGGSGLGLAISRKLVTLMGGTIWLKSEPGIGSCFSFTACLKKMVSSESGEDQRRELMSAVSRPGSILVVEDDPFSRTLMVHILEQQGYQIRTAVDGVDALEQLQKEPFNLVFLDIQLPVLDGAEVTRQIRSGTVRGCPTDLPIIAVTAYAQAGDRERFLAMGMSDYISKPIEISRLLAMLPRFLPQLSAAPKLPATAS